ncbi:DUF3426 domain-containing protein [Aestuariicella hydrocarbonica]|uniref:DUF3426 domain-containing protein n=1 Tax=Pseudomaricurvus hydrocarbonicus TaxID=1470433 RepID=A0A9E5MNM4_9GAMM|nr:DUF3426 domain-containing protein [Aestuariicella hydrocarbonica]NHO67523.1 DUF3426 domain-containing protein [Aestuariicella hydrocarbonica]
MADRVTSCPHCSTSFRITDAQLQTAKGAVRCGSCLQIFRALDHLLPLEPAPSDAVKPSMVEAAVNKTPSADKTPFAGKATVTGTASHTSNAPPEKTEAPTKTAFSLVNDPLPDDDASLKTEIERAVAKSSALLGDATTPAKNQPHTPAKAAPMAEDPQDEAESSAIDSPAAEQVSSEESPPQAAPLPPSADTHDDDDLLISDDMDQDTGSHSLHLGELSDSFRSQGNLGSSHKGSLFDREIKIDADLETDISDESWAVDLLQELGEPDTDDRDEDPEPTFSLPDDFDLEETEKQYEDQLFGDSSLDNQTDHSLFDDALLKDQSAFQTSIDSEQAPEFSPPAPEFSPQAPVTFELPDDIEAGDGTRDNDNRDDTLFRELGEDFSSSRKEPTFSLIEEDPLPQDNLPKESLYEAADYATEHYASDDYDAQDRDVSDSYNPGDDDPYGSEGDPYSTEAEPDHSLLLEGIARAPVEMEWQQEKSPWPRRLLWGGLSLLAAAVLAAQLAWYNFDSYSRIEPWRQGYMLACPMIGCQVPPIADPRRVKAYNLVVRSNPRAGNALIIDSILLNTANFEQPFPDFTLTFSNLQGKQLAYRRFTPREYLGGEMAGASHMPSGQPVHISLEILDPGPDAVNYTAAIPLD